jgi:hypothetical protein
MVFLLQLGILNLSSIIRENDERPKYISKPSER